MTLTRSLGQPSWTARVTSWYCRLMLSRCCVTCPREDWRTYTKASLACRSVVTFEGAATVLNMFIYLPQRAFPAHFLDHLSLWGLVIPIRSGFELYVNLRPIRLLPGIRTPLANRGPEEVDLIIIRENCEGGYSQIGGKICRRTQQEVVIPESVFTRRGVDRIQRYAFMVAERPKEKHLTSATKPNGIIHTMPLWDERFQETAMEFPKVPLTSTILTYWLHTSSRIQIGLA